MASALALRSLLVGSVLEYSSPAELLAGIFTPLIIKSSMPRGLKSDLAFSTTVTFAKPADAPALFEVLSVKLVPGLSDTNRISPVLRPALAVTGKSMLALTRDISSSRIFCDVRLAAPATAV